MNDLPDDAPWPDPLAQEVAELATGKLVSVARANQLLAEDRAPEAVALLRQTLRDYPDLDRAWYLLGKGLIQQNDLTGAEAALRQATRLAPDAVEYQYDLGTVLFMRRQPAAAAECFRKATALKPDFARAYYNLGHCLKQQGDRDGALEAFRNAVRSEPRLAAAHANLGELLAQQGAPTKRSCTSVRPSNGIRRTRTLGNFSRTWKNAPHGPRPHPIRIDRMTPNKPQGWRGPPARRLLPARARGERRPVLVDYPGAIKPLAAALRVDCTAFADPNVKPPQAEEPKSRGRLRKEVSEAKPPPTAGRPNKPGRKKEDRP